EQRAVRAVAVQEVLDHLELGRRRERDVALLAVRRHRALPLLGPTGALDELAPALRRAHADALRQHEAPVRGARTLVALSLVGPQVHADALGLVVGQVVARELDDVLAV